MGFCNILTRFKKPICLIESHLIGEILSKSMASPLAENNNERVSQLLKFFLQDEDFVRANIVNAQKKIIYTVDSGKIPDDNLMIKESFDLTDSDKKLTLGTLNIVYSKEKIDFNFDKEMYWVLLLVLFLIIVRSFALLNTLQKLVLKPISQLVEATRRIASGNLDEQVSLNSDDEIGTLALNLEIMRQSLKELIKPQEIRTRLSLQQMVHVTQESKKYLESTFSKLATIANQQESFTKEWTTLTQELDSFVTNITTMALELVNTMQNVIASINDMIAIAQTGQTNVLKTQTVMEELMRIGDTTVKDFENLAEDLVKINNMLGVIVRVADRTNLLSVNANIQAAKTKEKNHGFSVIGSEISRLAEETAIATLEIEKSVEEITDAKTKGMKSAIELRKEVSRGTSSVTTVNDLLMQISQQVQLLAPRLELINQAVQSQSTTAQNIYQKLGEMRAVGKEADELLKTFKKALDELQVGIQGD